MCGNAPPPAVLRRVDGWISYCIGELCGIPPQAMRPTFFLVLPKKNVPRPVQEKGAYSNPDWIAVLFCCGANARPLPCRPVQPLLLFPRSPLRSALPGWLMGILYPPHSKKAYASSLQPLHTSTHATKLEEYFSSSSQVISMALLLLPAAGNTVSNRCRDTSR